MWNFWRRNRWNICGMALARSMSLRLTCRDYSQRAVCFCICLLMRQPQRLSEAGMGACHLPRPLRANAQGRYHVLPFCKRRVAGEGCACALSGKAICELIKYLLRRESPIIFRHLYRKYNDKSVFMCYSEATRTKSGQQDVREREKT